MQFVWDPQLSLLAVKINKAWNHEHFESGHRTLETEDQKLYNLILVIPLTCTENLKDKRGVMWLHMNQLCFTRTIWPQKPVAWIILHKTDPCYSAWTGFIGWITNPMVAIYFYLNRNNVCTCYWYSAYTLHLSSRFFNVWEIIINLLRVSTDGTSAW